MQAGVGKSGRQSGKEGRPMHVELAVESLPV